MRDEADRRGKGEGGVFFFLFSFWGGRVKAEKGVGFNDEPEELQGIRGYPGWGSQEGSLKSLDSLYHIVAGTISIDIPIRVGWKVDGLIRTHATQRTRDRNRRGRFHC